MVKFHLHDGLRSFNTCPKRIKTKIIIQSKLLVRPCTIFGKISLLNHRVGFTLNTCGYASIDFGDECKSPRVGCVHLVPKSTIEGILLLLLILAPHIASLKPTTRSLNTILSFHVSFSG